MPRKKNSDCSEHLQLMRTLKVRLIEISLKVEKYIYKQKPINVLQAKSFLDEITSFKSHCQKDIGHLQVIEKLTKFMNIIISNNTTKSPVNDIDTNVNINDESNNLTLSNTNENVQTSTNIVSESINQGNTQNPTKNQNDLRFSLHNESTVDTEATDKDKFERDKTFNNKVEKRTIIEETTEVLENGGCIEDNNDTHLSHIENIVHGSAGYKDDKTATNNDHTLPIENKVQNSLKSDYRLLISVNGGVIHEIKHLSNATVIHQAPEVNIPLHEFALNNAKTPKNSSKDLPEVGQDCLTVPSSEEPKNVPVAVKRGRKINNKKVEFFASSENPTIVPVTVKQGRKINNKKVEFFASRENPTIVPVTVKQGREINNKKVEFFALSENPTIVPVTVKQGRKINNKKVEFFASSEIPTIVPVTVKQGRKINNKKVDFFASSENPTIVPVTDKQGRKINNKKVEFFASSENTQIVPVTVKRGRKIQNKNVELIASSEKPQIVPFTVKCDRKINNKKVKFNAPFIDLTKDAAPNKNKLDENNNNLASSLTKNNSERNSTTKQGSTKKVSSKNKKKELQGINDKKSEAIKRKVNENKNIVHSTLPKELKSSSNDFKAQTDLSWFDNIKYVRKIEEQEYFKPLQPLDANFWCNPSLLLSDDKEFNI